MVKRIIPGNMSPWECEINDVKYVYPPGTEQMVPDEVAHVIDAWYASREPKYPEPVQPEGGGGGGGAQPDWAANEGEPGHILNRTHYWKTVEGETIILSGLVAADEGMYLYLGDPVVFIPGREYSIWYANRTYNCIGIDPAAIGETLDGGCIFGNIGAITGGEDTGEPFVIVSYGRKAADVGGASVMIMDMSGSALYHVDIYGPRREREKIAPEWLPIPGVASVKFVLTSNASGNFVVEYNSAYEQLASDISNGFVVFATATIDGIRTYGMTFKRMDEQGILFACYIEEPGKRTRVHEITIPADGSSAGYRYDFIEY